MKEKLENLRIAMKPLSLLWLLLVVVAPAQSAEPGHQSVSLAGEWRFALDRTGIGQEGRWFAQNLPDRLQLPGALQSQGYGDPIGISTPWSLLAYDRFWYLREDYKAYAEPGHTKVPFLSQPPRHYLGAAWYQREVDVPASWRGRRVVLTLERPHWETTVWLDNQKIGTNNSLVAPHTYDFGLLAPGRHKLTIRIDNHLLLPYHLNTNSISDAVGSSWNGVVGKIELTATSPVWIDDARLYPDIVRRSALIEVRIGNLSGRAGEGIISVGKTKAPITWDADGGEVKFEVALGGDAGLWDEFHPTLHRLSVVLTGDGAADKRDLVFGLREFRASANQFVINGRPTHLRGTSHRGDFPLTGYPPTDVESWRRMIRTAKSWGLNHFRFQTFCPPEAAFTAADELGFYLQVDIGVWNELERKTAIEDLLYEETKRIIKAYGNHPSFVLFSLSGDVWSRSGEASSEWAGYFRRDDPRRAYTFGPINNLPITSENADYLATPNLTPYPLSGPRLWFGDDYRNVFKKISVPLIATEVGQWAAYPDFNIIRKFTGYLRPGNYEIFRDSMEAKGLLERNADFARASGRYQLAHYKQEIEANLSTPGLGGFQLSYLRDLLGYGSTFVGLLDAFGEQKSYVTAEEFRRFCGPTVPLVQMPKRVFTGAGKLQIEAEIAHYGAAPIANAVSYWKVVNAGGTLLAQGRLPARTIEVGGKTAVGLVEMDLTRLNAPAMYRLIVGIEGKEIENDWNFWVYPPQISDEAPTNVTVTNSWEEAEARLSRGGRVLYLPRRADLNWSNPPLNPYPIRWNRLQGPAWDRVLGLWCDSRHPALSGFPTTEHADWQWAELLHEAQAVNLDRLPQALQPIVQGIDDWNRNYKLGVLFECRVGSGRLMISTLDLDSAREMKQGARLLRRSLLDYMAGSQFDPQITVPVDALRGLLFDTLIMPRLNAVATALLPDARRLTNNGPEKAIDGNPNTYWFTGDSSLVHPHTLTVAFPARVEMAGLMLMPRQDDYAHRGDIRDYSVEVSDDGREWREVKAGTLTSSFAPQEITFNRVIATRQIRLTALTGFGKDGTAALAELAIIYAGPKLTDSIAGIAYWSVGAVAVGNEAEKRGSLLRTAPLGPAARFDFGAPDSAAPGYQRVLPTTIYGGR